MTFASPWWLVFALLAVPIVLAARGAGNGLAAGPRRAVVALQVVAVLLAAIALAGPWTASAGPVHRVVVWAAGDAAAARADLAALRAAVPRRDPFTVFVAGQAPRRSDPAADATEAGTPDLVRALRAAAAAIPSGAAGCLVLYTDDRHDGEELAALAAELTARGLPLHVRRTSAPAQAEVALLRVEHPLAVSPGEAFRLLLHLRARAAGSARLEVRAAEQVVATADLALAAGEQVRAVEVVLTEPGTVGLTATLAVVGAGPQTERSAVLVDQPLRILHLAADPSRRDALAATLRQHGIVAHAPDPLAPLAADATFFDCEAVLVDDVPAAGWLGNQGLVRTGVLQQGLGLVLAGTNANLGPGGYGSSPLADVLPVRMPQREERRDPSVGLVLIIDTSGSMGGGRIELAKEVARLAVQRLQPHDKVGIVEFYGSKRWAAPLQPATNTIEITRALNRLQAGGGTIIFDALEESYYALLNAQTRFKHILVLTDGGVESGPFEALARRMAAAGQTLSTVLIGPQASSPFLRNLAQWGRGRFYACPDRFQLPELQFREPQSALLPAVQERSLPLWRSAEAEAVAAFAGDQLPATGGIVEASVRRGAEVLLRTGGGEPYLVGWDQGAGRVLVLAGQTLGPHSGELRADPAYGAFLADLLRSAAAGRGAARAQLRARTFESGVLVTLQVPAGTHLPGLPEARLEERRVTLAPQGDAEFAAFVPWPAGAGGAHLLTAACGDVVLARGAVAQPGSRAGRLADHAAVLRQLVALSGGTDATAGAGAPLPQPAPASRPQPVSLVPWATGAALFLFLLAVLLRRWPWSVARARPMPGAGAALLLAMLGLAAAAPAQELPSADDRAAIRAAIDAELRHTGDLEVLAGRWQEAPPAHRLQLAMALGDLGRAARLLDEPPLRTTDAVLRVALLDVIGRAPQALAAIAELPAPPGATAVERGDWLLREAMLRHATGDRDGAAVAIRAAAAAAATPAFTQLAGVLAGSLGLHEVALELHAVPTAGAGSARDAFQAALRRGLWHERSGDPAAAAAAYQLAHDRAELRRDRAFALAWLVAVERRAGTLPARAERWLARAREGERLGEAELRVLLEVLRELNRPRDGLAVLAALPADEQAPYADVALDLALAAGDPAAAVAQLRARLAAAPDDHELRGSLAVLLADLDREEEARVVLREGIAGARPRALRALWQTSSQLAFDDVVAAIATAVAAGDEPGAATEAALLRVAHLRYQGRDAEAGRLLWQARQAAERPADRLKVAEQLESLGDARGAIELYAAIHAETGTEDVTLRLAWLLGESKDPADRARAAAFYRELWTRAGSHARRVQAEEQVLDLAAREGTLADLAIELEEQLADPQTPNRPAVRDALVKIYSRARDTVGAAAILRQWAESEPERAIEAEEQLARVYLAAEEFRNHERTLERLLHANPGAELDYRQQLAMSALERGRPALARDYIRAMLSGEALPDQVAIEFGAGIYSLAAQHEEAVRLYRRALALHPDRVETFLLLGNSLRAADQRVRAIGTFQELLLRDLPDDLFVVAVDGLLNMEAPNDALAAAVRAVRLRLAARPHQVFLHRVLQDLLEALGDDAARVRALEDTVVVAGEQRAPFVRELIQEAELRRDWPAYVAHGRTLLMLGEEVPPAVFLSLGEALLKAGDLDAATQAFARARLAPDFASVEVRIAELLEGADRLAEAERVRRRLLRRRPDDAASALAVARLCERQNAPERALPLYLATALRLLPAGLDGPRPAGRSVVQNRQAPQPTFAEAFAGALRSTGTAAGLGELRLALLAAATDADRPAERRLAAQQHLRQLALAFDDAALRTAVRQAEDGLAAAGDARLLRTILERRLQDGDLDGARAALPQGGAVGWEELRLALLGGDPAILAATAARAEVALLPGLGRTLLLAGRRAEAEALLPRLREQARTDPDEAAPHLAELERTLGMPVDEAALAQRRLAAALGRSGSAAQRVNAILFALRDSRGLGEAERRAHLLNLCAEVQTAGDANLAERVLAAGSDVLPATVCEPLVELLFRSIDRAYQIPSRVRHLRHVAEPRALELLRNSLQKVTADERRSQQLRILQDAAGVPAAVLTTIAREVDLDRLTPSDQYVLERLAVGDFAGPAAAVLAERLAAKRPQEPATLALQVRLLTDPAARRMAAVAAVHTIAGLREVSARSDGALALLLGELSAAEAQELLAGMSSGAPLQVRVPLLRRLGQNDRAAEALIAAYRKRPDDTALLFQAARILEADGLLERAVELYRTARDRAGTFYAHQAGQLARLELRLGRPAAALDALLAANDPMLTNYRLMLQALAGIGDAERRGSLLRRLEQLRAANTRSRVVFARMQDDGHVDTLAAALAPPTLPIFTQDDVTTAARRAVSDHDLLAFLPEGAAFARRLLRTLEAGQRDAEPGIYRGLLGSARRFGDAGAIVDGAVATLHERPHDAEALRIVLAAAQIGLPVPPTALHAAFERRISERRVDAVLLAETLAVAERAGDRAQADRVLTVLVQQRPLLTDMRLRPWLAAVLALACRHRPDLVVELQPGAGDPLEVDLDGEILAAAALGHPDPQAVARAFGPAVERFAGERAGSYRDTLLWLPWAGVLLRSGDLAAAIAALERRPDQPFAVEMLPPHLLAAALPDLAGWQDPAAAQPVADLLVRETAGGAEDRRGICFRLGAVLAARLAAAGRDAEAASLRGRLREAAAGLAVPLADWLGSR